MTLVVLGGCASPKSVEHRLIGTWESPDLYWVGIDRSVHALSGKVMEVTFRPDKTETWRYRGGPVLAVASWHVEGNDLVLTLRTRSESGPPGAIIRETITKITSKELVFGDGTKGRWTRVR
jgi:hypothetical protein